ncbi:hypothetical protein F0562_023602 [Nyssa sinensis]|uniref:Uncharacterized protein n=1 Tax=Nyssa sinensis TaxID=561372 RepID=A0A5J5BKM5_9ASTE|nr:hypothetical protein F0562_023602 [Nyssa sinensis]
MPTMPMPTLGPNVTKALPPRAHAVKLVAAAVAAFLLVGGFLASSALPPYGRGSIYVSVKWVVPLARANARCTKEFE